MHCCAKGRQKNTKAISNLNLPTTKLHIAYQACGTEHATCAQHMQTKQELQEVLKFSIKIFWNLEARNLNNNKIICY